MQSIQCILHVTCVHDRDHCVSLSFNPRYLAGVVVWMGILLSLVLLAGSELPFGTQP